MSVKSSEFHSCASEDEDFDSASFRSLASPTSFKSANSPNGDDVISRKSDFNDGSSVAASFKSARSDIGAESFKSANSHFGDVSNCDTGTETFKTARSSDFGPGAGAGASSKSDTFKSARSEFDSRSDCFKSARSDDFSDRGSQSTLYFSPNDNDTDLDCDSVNTLFFSSRSDFDNQSYQTLFWSVNGYNDCQDELSDTSTLVDGELEEEADAGADANVSSEVLDGDVAETTSQDCLHVNDDDDRFRNRTNSLDQESPDIVEETCTTSASTTPNYSTSATTSDQSFRVKQIVPLDRRWGALNFLVLLIATASSIGVHAITNIYYSSLNSWNLVFFRGLAQVAICLLANFIKTRCIFACCPCFGNFGQHAKAMSLGLISFATTISWLFIEDQNFIPGTVTSIFYLTVPVLILVLEFVIQTGPLNVKCTVLILLSWLIGLGTFGHQFCFGTQNGPGLTIAQVNITAETKVFSLDPVFGWSLKAADNLSDITVPGLLLAIFASLGQVFGLVTLAFVKADNQPHWSLLMAWQGLGALIASSIGFIIKSEWPSWCQNGDEDWWQPLVLLILGLITNFCMVKLLLLEEPKSLLAFRCDTRSPTTLILLKAIPEAIFLAFFNYPSVKGLLERILCTVAFSLCYFCVLIYPSIDRTRTSSAS